MCVTMVAATMLVALVYVYGGERSHKTSVEIMLLLPTSALHPR